VTLPRGTGDGHGWLVVGCLVLTPLALWAAAEPLGSKFASSTAALGSAANITGIAGTAAFAANLVIGSRIPVIVRLFGGPEEMYAAHRRLGVYAFGLLVAHAALAAGRAAADSAGDAFELFLPTSGWAVFAGSIALACMSAGLALPSSRKSPTRRSSSSRGRSA